MLIEKFIHFVNFTSVNSHFLSGKRVCKRAGLGENCCFGSASAYSETQIKACFQSRIWGWQNTIFDFLDAQLDFLAIFFTHP